MTVIETFDETAAPNFARAMPNWQPLVEYRRNGVAENTIHGAVSWVTGRNLLYSFGGNVEVYGRSMVKPIMMKVFARDFARELTPEQRAISVASHNGDAEHVATARSILREAEWGMMQAPLDVPLVQFGRQVRRPRRWYHCCSGEHAAILRGCRIRGWRRVGYVWPHHPFFQEYLAYLRGVLAPDWTDGTIAKDGCGLPTVSMTVTDLAKLFANLVTEKDEDWIWDAMTAHPDLIGGFNRLDSTILKACGGRVLAKEGADGLLGLSIEHPEFPEGLGVVVKIAHGWNPQATWYIARYILGVLGFEFRNPYKLRRQKAFIVPEVIPPQLRDRMAAIVPWDSWDPDIDRWEFEPEELPLRLANFIDGAFVPPQSGAYFDDLNPATAEVIAEIPDSDRADVDAAVEAAKRAFPAWSRTPAEQRSRVLLELADLIERNLDELALCESQDNGKPVSLARRMDIPRAVANFRFFATAILHQASEAHMTDNVALNYTLRQPIGVAGLISPWNLPLYLLSWKIAPAIASGNTCVAKPSELTPLTAQRLAELSLEAGLPPGVLNIVHGTGPKAGAAICEHPDVPMISFTGGTVTGAKVAAAAAPLFKKLSLELGGKNPNLIFADADLDEAVATSIRSSFWNQGEICLCGSRIFVERAIYDTFVERFVAATKKLRIGDPTDAQTDVGALISEAHLEKVMRYLALAKEEGGTIVTGGNRVDRPGYFLEPAIVTGLGCECRVLQEEIFGPVVTITPFDGDDEAVAFANSTRYGLSATVWTRDLKRAHRVAAELHAGTVWINCWLLRDLRVPFGGAKESGVGREGGFESLQFFTEAKNVCVKLD